MENKEYFTPEISDFCIGYEYETIYLKSVWTKESLRIMDAGWFFESYENDAVPTEFRVPYLTKEQIEAEGWKIESEIKGYFKFKNYHLSFDYVTGLYRMRISKDEDLRENLIFEGTCKDINTFRKIIKLLKV